MLFSFSGKILFFWMTFLLQNDKNTDNDLFIYLFFSNSPLHIYVNVLGFPRGNCVKSNTHDPMPLQFRP